MKNWVILRSPVGTSAHWTQFTAMTAWTRQGAIAKVEPNFAVYRYIAIPARWWKWYE